MAKVKEAIEEFVPDPRDIDERGPTPERKRRMGPSPIETAVGSGKLTKEQGRAAEEFQKTWAMAGLIDSIPSADMAREVFGSDGFSVMARTELQAAKRHKYRSAVKRIVTDKGFLSLWVTEQIVCHEKGFIEVGGLFGHKRRNTAAEVSFQILSPVLNLLCKEWGIE